jgi:arginyl-tRNA synthetase
LKSEISKSEIRNADCPDFGFRISDFGFHMNLLQLLQQKLHDALTGLIADPAPYAAMVKPTQDARYGDYQANCAMSLKKIVGQEPRAVAQTIKDRLDLGDMLEEPEIAGPGFINIRLRPDWLAAQIQKVAPDDWLGVDKASPTRTFVIDYSSPNVAKPMHVGHLRSTIIGDALKRLLRFLGHTVIADNHLGDWGTQFGILLYGYKHFRDEAALKADPVRELARLYIHVRGLMKTGEDEDDAVDPIADAARQETAKLHAGDPENLRLWQMFMPWCLEEINGIYRRLDVQFDCTLGESFYNPMLPDVVRDLLGKGIARESDGALVIFFGENEPPALVRKRDGAYTYTTTDLATVRYRTDKWHPDAMLYAVDFRQTLVLKQLFEAARRWGYDRVELQHISFGSVLGKNGKPLKTREGEVVELGALLDEAVGRAATVYAQSCAERTAHGHDVPELSPDEHRQVVEAVGLGAVKYADLSQNRTSDYTFDWDKMLAMEGNTAAYMQYAYARNRSIFRKGGEDVARFRAAPPAVSSTTPSERALAVQLLRFEDALRAAASEYKPNLITAYLWDLAKCYSGFFESCPVIKAETPALRDSRFLLCDLTARVIQRGLDLLGIRTVERM